MTAWNGCFVRESIWLLPTSVATRPSPSKLGWLSLLHPFKLIIIDSAIAYVGSANLTGAGMGMKSSRRRNFEAGILTDDPEMVEAAIEQFDNVWMGKFCKDCGRRDYCADPIK